ncbi:MAG: DUF2157 domain-containing protein [Cyanobacteria bacterium P01_C01_bin.70]
MKIERHDLEWAVNENIIQPETAERLWQAWRERQKDIPQFNFTNVAYYFGALIVIAGMSLLMNLAWEQLGGSGIFMLASIYVAIFTSAGWHLWFNQELKIPGGLLTTVAVCIVPLAIYGFQRMVGIWPQDDPGSYSNYHVWVKASWFYMEVGTILAGLLALRWIRFPFITAPIAYTLWYMSMDLTPLIFGKESYTWDERLWVSFWFGLATIVVAFLIDRRIRRSQGDFAFWLYLSGLMAFWGGMTFMGPGSEWEGFLYCLINLFLIGLSILLRRRVFALFGGMGVLRYLGYLAFSVFQDALLFPIALSFVGVLMILGGVQYQRNYAVWEAWLHRVLPASLLNLLPKET